MIFKKIMTNHFSVLPLADLLKIIINQYDQSNHIFGISEKQFFNPKLNKSLNTKRFKKLLETPLGVAAGPHSQMAQNIVVAWLMGARFIELKTIQTLDELSVSKPCIDMQDEGYNCEWSQELKIHQSFEQYLNAWIIIHILRDKFKWANTDEPGIIFNMSVGYNYEGILKDNVQWFFNKMNDCSKELSAKSEHIKSIYPNIGNLDINPQISNNITLSTMHGCPADEIEKIGKYLITEKKLHTAIKLNPTLVGKKKLHQILQTSGFETKVPDIAFEHDLKYKDAISIIKNLQEKATENQLHFSLKLTNTLESVNHKDIFPSDEKMMYMSGRALHPISINLAYKLQKDFNNQLDISFSGGADAFNVADIVNCGLAPVTVCTDLLKPGGYGRLQQYIEALNKSLSTKSSFAYLKKYTEEISSNNNYKKLGFHDPSIKTNRPLGFFDCTHAPCVDTCPTNQGIPDYMYYTSQGDFKKAAEIIKQTNPFPLTTGMVCDHLCQTKCTRINYDSPVLIREIKRFIAETTFNELSDPKHKTISSQIITAAIIGAGPSGLSCAYYLTQAGMKVNIYESKAQAGGMVSGAIPSFRLTDKAIDIDIKKIEDSGVIIHYNYPINKNEFRKIREENNFVYIGIGAQLSKPLFIDGIKTNGVLDPLDFLFRVKENKKTGIGTNVIIIGGGNTAMDAARTAFRMVGKNGKVTIVYRRTIKQMPADLGEIKAVLEEGIDILELSAPVKVKSESGHVKSLICKKMILGDKDDSGRATFIEIQDSEFELSADTIIPAIGQNLDIDFAEINDLATKTGTYQTSFPQVYIGGDALRGASTAINAIGDGRKAAQEIINKAGIVFNTKQESQRNKQPLDHLMIKKSKRIEAQSVVETNLNNRKNFQLVSTTLTKEEALKEASRCLLCDEVCNICTSVCPNLAFHSYEIEPLKYVLQNILITGRNFEKTAAYNFEVKQIPQILHIADWCNQCGNCHTFCPSAGSPYLNKPHLYLDKEVFKKQKDAYFLDTNNEVPELKYYHNNQLYRYKVINGFKQFETDQYRLKLDNDFKAIDIEIIKNTNCEINLLIPAEMSLIYLGAIDFMGK